MKKVVGLFIMMGILTMPSMAFAGDTNLSGMYVGGHVGMSINNFSSRTFHDLESDFRYSPSSETDTEFGGGLSVGYDFALKYDVPVRLELDYTARSRGEAKSTADILEESSGKIFGTTKSDKVALQTLMLNTWIDIPTNTAFTPYIGGGVGFGFINYRTSLDFIDKTAGVENGFESGSTNETNFAWSLGTGVAYDVTDRWTVDLGYRYIDAGEASKSFKDDSGTWAKYKAKVQTHDIMLGIRYAF